MKTAPDSLQINAFIDGQLDLASQLEIEQRLRDDEALRSRVESARQLRDSIKEEAAYYTAPAALRERLGKLAPPYSINPAVSPAAVPPPAASASQTPRRQARSAAGARAGWVNWKALAASASAVAVLAIASSLVLLQSSSGNRLAEEVLASHVRSTVGERLVDVASSDHHTVKPFLSSKLGFSPPVDELEVPGSKLIGGRVDYLGGRPVAALVYHQGLHVVNSFVWPSTQRDSKPDYSSDRGFLIAHWTEDGMAHWVISDVNRDEFRAVVTAIEQQDMRR